MDDFLQKPVVLGELKEVLDKWSNPEALKKLALRNQPDSPVAVAEMTFVAVSDETPAAVPEVTRVAIDDFQAIDERLKSIKDKIASLRKKHGMD